MLTNAKFQHLGFATPDIEATVGFYTESLGFEVIHRTATPDGLTPIVFIRNGAADPPGHSPQAARVKSP